MATITFDVSAKAEGNADNLSLQDAFLGYRRKRQDELRDQKQQEQLSMEARTEPSHMAELRSKFLDRAKSYIGIPYAKRYHQPESPTHHAPLFLDCCGLVRQVLRDLKEEFGFTVGPWNQSYMYDTLPISLSGPDEMQPGDLVFVSGVYFNEKAKKQRHNMVHVEIWLGEGHKALGARWQRRFVEVHDSYQFVSKSYHSMIYHFKSIDTWLQGICESVCPEHPWRVRKFDPSKKSIFALSQDACNSCDEGEACDSGEPCEDGDVICDSREAGDPSDGCDSSESHDNSGVGGSSKLCKNDDHQSNVDTLAPVSSSITSSANKESARGGKAKTRSSPVGGSSRLARTFLTCGGNCATLVESALIERGWVRCEDKTSTSFILKWTELKKQIDYKLFREGEQIVNHFPNIGVLTTKIGLLESLRSYCKIHRPSVKLEVFFPLTYRLDSKNDLEEFMATFTDGELWICKPTGANQGKGIFLVRQLSQVLEKLEWDKAHCKPTTRPTPRIVQRYISNPLLLNGRKFDIRVYMLVLGSRPFLVFYREGYIRLCCEHYTLHSESLIVHLTNQYQQKKHPLYSEVKEDTVWGFDKFQQVLSSEHGLPSDWVQGTLRKRMTSIMSTCFNSVKHKLSPTNGFFDLLGFDFMLDAALSVWLIEVNVNPALHTNCETLAALSPSIISETLDIAIEVFDKNRRNKTLLPLNSPKHFTRINC